MASTRDTVHQHSGAVDSRISALLGGVSRIPALSLTFAVEAYWRRGRDRRKTQNPVSKHAVVALRALSGGGTFFFETRTGQCQLELSSPSVVLFNHRDLRHTTVNESHLNLRWFEFAADADVEHWYFQPVVVPVTDAESETFCSIQEHLTSERGNDHLYATALFSQLLYGWLKDSDIDGREPNQRIVSEAMSLIQEGVYEDVSVELVARQLHTHPSSLRRLFQIHVGISPKQYLDWLRFQEAKRLFQDGLLAKQISKRLSFKNESHFSRFFKGHSGVTPREYQSRFRVQS